MTHHSSNLQLTTFRVPVNAVKISKARWPQEFLSTFQRCKKEGTTFFILGQGANTLFLEDFAGEILINDYTGIKVFNNSDHYLVEVNSGVTIDHLLDYLHRYKIYGMENLTSIPSSVGTAIIGNIGAYGLEFERFVVKVKALNLESGEEFELDHQQCKFSYRNSIFKSKYTKNMVVLSVTLAFPKAYQPILTYAPLDQLDPSTDPKVIRSLVRETRARKLPNYQETGNGGSFFINPIVSEEQYQKLLALYPQLVSYPAGTGTRKLSAGWLIEQAGLKGLQLGNAQVSPLHSLVLINANQEAQGQEIAKLAALVRQKVLAKFGVALVPEIRFIGKNGEVDAPAYLDQLAQELA